VIRYNLLKITTATLAIALIITTTQAGKYVRIQENGYGPIDFGFPFAYITYNYAPDDWFTEDTIVFGNNLETTPEDLTLWIWLRRIGDTYKSSSINILGMGLNFMIYYYSIRYCLRIGEKKLISARNL